MKKTTSTSALRFAVFAAAGAAACAWAPQAAADDAVPTADLGAPADVGGGQQWTVTGLQPSADQIAAAPAGSLWEATATAAPMQGGVPVVPGFAARTPDGQDYPVMWNVPTPLGINPSPLPAGESATGKLYFDVTGAAPDSVAYNRDGQDVAVWVQPPPPVGGPAPTTYGSGAGATAYAPPMQAAPAPVSVPRAAAPAPAAPAPAPAGSSGTPAPAAAAPATAGSSGTPQPATGSVGTPATPGSTTATPASTTPAPAGAAPAAAAPQASTSPAGGTAPAGGPPAPAAAPTTPAPASAALPGTGSSGTTFTVPMTTPVPVPAG